MGWSSAATLSNGGGRGVDNLVAWKMFQSNHHHHHDYDYGQRVFNKSRCLTSHHCTPISHGVVQFSNLNPNISRRAYCLSSKIEEAIQLNDDSDYDSEYDYDERSSSTQVKKEIEMCYELIHRLGRGVVYLGSARMGPGHDHYIQTQELARQVASLLGCTSWSGAGPGLMDAATRGALQAGKPVGGFKIGKEANEWTSTNFHPYLPSHTYLTCRFFSARKHGLVDAVVRTSNEDKTAVIVLPGGIGTLDEAFEILALIQLQRIGSALPVPFVLLNYDSFYSKLLEFLDVCEDWGTVSKGEVSSLWKVCNNNSEALAHLAKFYGLDHANQQ